jgi:ubiquinone/menaquinone biosynthesis C-methylase UbiE
MMPMSNSFRSGWHCPSCQSPNPPADRQADELTCTACRARFGIVDGIPGLAPGPHDPALEADLEEMSAFAAMLRERRPSLTPTDPACFRLPHRHVRSELAQEAVEIPWLQETLGSLAGKKVLNVSCGLGRDADILIGRLGASDLTLCDISMSSLVYAREAVAEAFPACTLDAVQCSASELPWPDDTFDLVFVWASAHHYLDLDRFLGSACRVASSVVLAAEPAPLAGIDWFFRLVRFNAEYGGLPTARLDPEALRRAFSAHGFDSVWRRSNFYVYPLFDRIADVPGVIPAYAACLRAVSRIIPPRSRHGVSLVARRRPGSVEARR